MPSRPICNTWAKQNLRQSWAVFKTFRRPSVRISIVGLFIFLSQHILDSRTPHWNLQSTGGFEHCSSDELALLLVSSGLGHCSMRSSAWNALNGPTSQHPNGCSHGSSDWFAPGFVSKTLFIYIYIDILHDVISRTHLKCQFTLKKVHQTVYSWDQKFPAYPIPMVYVFWSVHIDTISQS